MTIVAGILTPDRIYMGADTLLSSDDSKVTISRPKIFRRGEMLIGYSGSLREGQVIETDFSPPKKDKKEEDYIYIAQSVTGEFDKIMSKYKLEDRSANSNEFNSCWLIAYGNAFYEMQFDLSVLVPRRNYAAIGTAPAQYAALGTLFALKETSMGPQEQLELALRAAESVCPSVAAPFDFLSIERGK